MGCMSLASYVIEKRTEVGLRATDLASASGLTKSYISELERGKIALPNADIRRRLAKALGVSHLDLLVAAGEITPQELGTVAGIVERDPDDPRTELHQMLDDVRLSRERFMTLRRNLETMLEIDREARE